MALSGGIQCNRLPRNPHNGNKLTMKILDSKKFLYAASENPATRLRHFHK